MISANHREASVIGVRLFFPAGKFRSVGMIGGGARTYDFMHCMMNDEMLREIYCKIVIIVFQLNAGKRKKTIEKLMN
jgi:hypothetical protein